MEFAIRPMDWDDRSQEGIPFDCKDVMEYFNRALEKNLFPLVPRTNPITAEEIRDIWMPGKDWNIAYVAQCTNPDHPKVVGSGTVFVDSDRKEGEYHLTINPDFFRRGLANSITKAVIEECRNNDMAMRIRTSVHNLSVRNALNKMGFWPVDYDEQNDSYTGRITPPENSRLPPFAALHYTIR